MYPVLISYGPLLLSALWAMIVVGFIAGCFVFMKLALKTKLKLYFFRIYFFKILIFGLLFSRLIFIITNLDFYFSDFGFGTIIKLVSFWDKGLSFWGAAAGIVFAFIIYAKREKENLAKWLDVLAVSISSSMVFGYIGAFLQGINYGTPTELPWGITLENIEIQYTTAIHPVQLYGALFMIILTTALTILLLKNKLWHGGVALTGALSYSIFRFLEEFLRGSEITTFLGLRYPQWLAIAGFIISLIFLLKGYNLLKPMLRFFKKLKLTRHE